MRAGMAVTSEIGPLNQKLTDAKTEFENTFWDDKQGFYAYTAPHNQDRIQFCWTHFFAQHIAARLELPDLVNIQRYQRQLAGTYAAYMSWRDPEGRLIGAPNMLAGKGVKEWPLFGVLGAVQEEGVWPGVNYFVASTYVAARRRFGNESLIKDGIEMGSAVSKQIWVNNKNGYASCSGKAICSELECMK